MEITVLRNFHIVISRDAYPVICLVLHYVKKKSIVELKTADGFIVETKLWVKFKKKILVALERKKDNLVA